MTKNQISAKKYRLKNKKKISKAHKEWEKKNKNHLRKYRKKNGKNLIRNGLLNIGLRIQKRLRKKQKNDI